uniref:J domain-containing protein n=1 Tax=Skeletonema marinoi TaxID=267567 RepID=A0A7S2PUW1_9STRA|mmetsp:Transcript_32661/g.55225  ORF Transcript_32661/g.55225 Transcript_32661/m.55225 type:complete len:1291 (+) Transcript_32661:222-4094(+)
MSSDNETPAGPNAYNIRNGDPTMGSLRNLLESLRFDMHGTGGGGGNDRGDFDNDDHLNGHHNNNMDGNAVFGAKEDEHNFNSGRHPSHPPHHSYDDTGDEAQRQRSSENNYRFNDPNLTDDDESFASGSYGPSDDDDSVESFEDAGYDNEEDYLFDQYGGIGGTAEERAELAEALMHTLNVGPMADDLFYEEVAMCFLRCRERHRMRTKREEMRQRARQKKLRRKKKQHHQKGGISDSDVRRTESEISDTGDDEEVANRMRKMNMGNVDSDFNLNRTGTEDDDSIEDDVNVESDYHIDSDYGIGARRTRSRRRMKSNRGGGYSSNNNSSNIDEEDGGVETADDDDLSTGMSSSDRDDEDSFMGGKNHHSPHHRRRHHHQPGNHFGDSTKTGAGRVEADMENDYEDDTAYGVYGGLKEDEDHDNEEDEDEDVPVFRVNLKSEKPNNRKKAHGKKGGGGRYPPPPPPPPPPRGGDHGSPAPQNYDVPSSPMDMEVDEDLPNEGSYSWQETLAKGANAAAEASAMKNDHESLRKGFNIGQSSSDSEKKSSFAPRRNKPARADNISQAAHSRSQTLDDATEMDEENAEGSDKRKLVASLRDEGRSHYINGAYRESVQRYTEAISTQTDGFTKNVSHSSFDETLAALYGNRAAALMMTGAYEGAAADCGRALQCTEDHSSAGSLESGPAFRSKILCRMARACLKAGSTWDAEQAFNSAIQSAQEALAQIAQSNVGADETRQAEKILNQSINDATLGLTDVRRYREALEGAAKIAAEKGVSAVAERRNSVQLLMFINSALSVSPGSMELHERKVNALASLKRWAELGNHCERLAAEMAKIDGVFKDDLSALNPFPDVRPATSLKSDFFERNPDAIDDPAPFRILSPKAVCDAVLRLPNGIIPLYLRSLRLEERYTEAAKAGSAIETHMSNSKHKGTRGNVPVAWLSNERDKLRKTMSWKEKGDGLFRKASYEKAAEKYGSCLTIDSDTTAAYDAQNSDIDDAGGRLHAVLHCNRAACLMALKKYREAVKECTAALRIHTHYMKAMLRRGRCFARIRQYQEAVAEYERYIQLVDEAKRSPESGININAACTFDRPADITDAEYSKAKQELLDVKKSMRQSSNVNANAQANSKKQAGQQQWYNSQFAKAAASNAAKRKDTAGRSNAYTRKQQWDAGANQRRYDPFGGSSPKKAGSRKKDAPAGDSRTNRARHNNNNQQPQQPNVVKNPDCHYEVLGLSATASSADIKKSYHKMALKYHPDKNQEEGAADIFRRVKLAYEVLGDDSTRIAYDAERRRRR